MQADHHYQMRSASEALYASLAHLPDSQNWFVALSGGADSRALTDILAQIAPGYRARLTALIVNHNLRPEAKAEAEWVANNCAKAGIEAQILTVTAAPPEGARQEWARTQRYQLLSAYARRHGGLLWLGHHFDDQTETVAMRLAHDSGFAGLAGMKAAYPMRGVYLLRPFLPFPKKALVDYCHAQKLAFVEDPSNHNRDFERVRWRSLLASDKALVQDLAELSGLASRFEAGIRRALDDMWERHVHFDETGLWAKIDKAAYMSLAAGAKLSLMRRLLMAIGGNDYPPSFAATRHLISDLERKSQATLGYCLIRFHGPWLLILPEAGRNHQLAGAPMTLKAGEEVIFGRRLLVRAACDCRLSRMDAQKLASWLALLPSDDAYRLALSAQRVEVRMIFPFVRALDERPITPHIKKVVQLGHFVHANWPSEGVAIHPLQRVAKSG